MKFCYDISLYAGPHLHFEFRKGINSRKNGNAIEHYNMEVGNVRHDKYCSDPREGLEQTR